MKILGSTKGGYIVECDCHEMRNLLGIGYGTTMVLNPGDTVDISSTWDRLRDVLSLRQKFSEVRGTLDSMSRTLAFTGEDIVRSINPASTDAAKEKP